MVSITSSRFFLLITVLLAGVVFHTTAWTELTDHVLIDEITVEQLPAKAYVRVLDENGRHVKGLKLSDFRVYVDGNEISHPLGKESRPDKALLLNEETVGRESVFLAIAFDTSRSISNAQLLQTKNIAQDFIKGLPSQQKVLLVSVSEEVKKGIGFTDDMKQISQAIEALENVGKYTFLHDAICDALDALYSVPSQSKMLVIFSDGEDDGSVLTENDCVEKAKEYRIPVHSVLLRASAKGYRFLKRLSRTSGGMFFDWTEVEKPETLAASLLDRVSALDGLRTRYIFTFDHPHFRQSGQHELRVDMWDAKTREVRASSTTFFLVPQRGMDVGRLVGLAAAVIACIAFGAFAAFIILKYKHTPALTSSTAPVTDKPELGKILSPIRDIHARIRDLDSSVQNLGNMTERYGGTREDLIARWRGLCLNILGRMSPVLEICRDFEKFPEIAKSVKEAASAVHGRLWAELTGVGVEEICPSPGDAFNPKIHRSVDSAGAPPYNRVKEVVSPGYMFRPRLGGKPGGEEAFVIKPAEVIVEGAAVEGPSATAIGHEMASQPDDAVTHQSAVRKVISRCKSVFTWASKIRRQH